MKNNSSFKTKISKRATSWQEIAWQEVILKVRDLQDQIVKAATKNDMITVYRLQRILVTSFEGRALAVRRVVTSSGGKTPGIDQITWLTPAG